MLQPKATSFAAEHALSFSVRTLGGASGTLVGAPRTRLAGARARTAPLRVALAGLGTVGLGVFHALHRDPEAFELVSVLVRDPRRAGREEVPRALYAADADALLGGDYDVFVELAGGIEPARSWIARALARGVDVVTANKALIAEHGPELDELARASGARLLRSASVGGATPVLEPVRRAQELGFAESDPARDLDGCFSGAGIALDTVDASRPELVHAALRPDTALVLIESPTNPLLDIADVARLAELCHNHGAALAVDNSLLSPYLQRPLELGADLVVRSATKYLAGHGDVMAGAIVCAEGEWAERAAAGRIDAPLSHGGQLRRQLVADQPALPHVSRQRAERAPRSAAPGSGAASLRAGGLGEPRPGPETGARKVPPAEIPDLPRPFIARPDFGRWS